VNKEEDQRKLQSLLLQIKSYQSALQDISRQSAFTERAMVEIMSTLKAIEELPKSKESEALIPIGAGIYVKADILDKKNLIVSISSEITAEKTAAETKTFLEDKKTRLEANDQMLKDQAKKIAAELEAANSAAEELYVKVQGK